MNLDWTSLLIAGGILVVCIAIFYLWIFRHKEKKDIVEKE